MYLFHSYFQLNILKPGLKQFNRIKYESCRFIMFVLVPPGNRTKTWIFFCWKLTEQNWEDNYRTYYIIILWILKSGDIGNEKTETNRAKHQHNPLSNTSWFEICHWNYPFLLLKPSGKKEDGTSPNDDDDIDANYWREKKLVNKGKLQIFLQKELATKEIIHIDLKLFNILSGK